MLPPQLLNKYWVHPLSPISPFSKQTNKDLTTQNLDRESEPPFPAWLPLTTDVGGAPGNLKERYLGKTKNTTSCTKYTILNTNTNAHPCGRRPGKSQRNVEISQKCQKHNLKYIISNTNTSMAWQDLNWLPWIWRRCDMSVKWVIFRWDVPSWCGRGHLSTTLTQSNSFICAGKNKIVTNLTQTAHNVIADCCFAVQWSL